MSRQCPRKPVAGSRHEYAKQLARKGLAVNNVDQASFVTAARDKLWPRFGKQHGKDMQAIVTAAC